MLSPQANLRLLQRTSWSGYVYIAFLMVGIWPLARFFPSQPPSWNAAQITQVLSRQHRGDPHRDGPGTRWLDVLRALDSDARQAHRGRGGKPGILTFCQIIAGCTNVLLTAYPAGWWLTASFRSDRDPQIVQLLNDIAWLQFLGVIAPFYFVVISIIYASLADEDTDPIIPRWVGWFNVFFMLDLIPLSIIFFFKTGPFAWNGLFGFYLPFATFWIWFFVMTYTIRRSLHRLDDVSKVPAASAEAA